jgi:predicted nucleotidyltransferase
MVPTDRERQTAIDQLVALLSADDRIVAVVLVGSAAGGKTDRWSDVDLEVAVDGSADTSAVAADWVTRMYAEFEVAHHFEVSFGATLVRGFLLTGLLEVDLSFESVNELSVWEPARLLFDRAGAGAAALARPATWEAQPPDYPGESGFTWHDVLHACAAVERGRPWQAVFYLQRVRNRALSLASQRYGNYADFFDYVDDLPAEERAPLEGSLVGSLAEGDLVAAIESATGGYLAELRRGDPALAARLGPPLLEMVAAVRDRPDQRPPDAR